MAKLHLGLPDKGRASGEKSTRMTYGATGFLKSGKVPRFTPTNELPTADIVAHGARHSVNVSNESTRGASIPTPIDSG